MIIMFVTSVGLSSMLMLVRNQPWCHGEVHAVSVYELLLIDCLQADRDWDST